MGDPGQADQRNDKNNHPQLNLLAERVVGALSRQPHSLSGLATSGSEPPV